MIYIQLFYFSAGIGRTGTFIVLDMLTYKGEDRGSVDIFGPVAGIRYQRCNMVQTPVFTCLLIELIYIVSMLCFGYVGRYLIWLCFHLIKIPQNYWELHFGSQMLSERYLAFILGECELRSIPVKLCPLILTTFCYVTFAGNSLLFHSLP